MSLLALLATAPGGGGGTGGVPTPAYVDHTPPPAPSFLGEPTITSSSIGIAWDAAAGILSHFELSIDNAASTAWVLTGYASYARAYTFTGLTASTLYTILLRTVDQDGTPSEWVALQATTGA